MAPVARPPASDDRTGVRGVSRSKPLRAAAALLVAGVLTAACGESAQRSDDPDGASGALLAARRAPSVTRPSRTPEPPAPTVPESTANPAIPPVTEAASLPETTAPPAGTVAVTAAATTAPPTAAPPPPTTAAPAPPPPARTEPRNVLVISDSSGAQIRWTVGASDPLMGAAYTLDLESCRRLVAQSCSGREGYRPSTALGALRNHAGAGHDTVVMITGYNDQDADFDAAFDAIFEEVRVQGVETVLWMTYREDVAYEPAGVPSSYSAMNQSLWLRAMSGNYPELVVVDWWRYTADVPHWLRPDGVHLSPAGAYGMSDLISRSLAAVDGLPCPAPWELEVEPLDPCPPPVEERLRLGYVPPVEFLYMQPPE